MSFVSAGSSAFTAKQGANHEGKRAPCLCATASRYKMRFAVVGWYVKSGSTGTSLCVFLYTVCSRTKCVSNNRITASTSISLVTLLRNTGIASDTSSEWVVSHTAPLEKSEPVVCGPMRDCWNIATRRWSRSGVSGDVKGVRRRLMNRSAKRGMPTPHTSRDGRQRVAKRIHTRANSAQLRLAERVINLLDEFVQLQRLLGRAAVSHGGRVIDEKNELERLHLPIQLGLQLLAVLKEEERVRRTEAVEKGRLVQLLLHQRKAVRDGSAIQAGRVRTQLVERCAAV